MARRVRAAAANGNVYLTSAAGVLKSTGASSDITAAGTPRALDPTLTLVNPGTAVLLADSASLPDQARAYRIVWCLRDANNNVVTGAPSSRVFVVNIAAGTRDVSIAVPIPPEITTSHFLQIYASAIVNNGTTTPPDDEMRLVQEYFPTSTDISNGSCTIVDIVPDAFRGADLYTNETQEGQARQNDRPPLCRDLAYFNNKMIGSNLTDPHRMPLQMVGTSGMTTQTITLGGVVYTAGTAESTTTGTFQVFKPGGGGYTDKGTQALNVEFTAKSLVNVINKYAATTSVYAWYESGYDDAPGKILVEERGVGGSAFVVICSAAAMGSSFSPSIPTSGSTYTSVADRRVNEIAISKPNQPEHMPRARRIKIGGGDEEIQRILALKSSLIIIKDRSIWRLTDAEPGEAPVLIDNTCGIAGRDSAAVLNNAVYMLSDQGFVCITENGIQIVGRPIEDKILPSLAATTDPHDSCVGVGFERERYYMCSVYDPVNDEVTCYRYSPISNGGRGAWTTRHINSNAFVVNGNRADSKPWFRDHAEESSTFVISSVDSNALTVTGTMTQGVDYDGYEPDEPSFGWKAYEGAGASGALQYLVTASSGTYPSLTLTLNTVSGLSASDTLTLFRPVSWKLEYAPITAKNPLELKGFHEVSVKAETCNAHAVDISFANELDTKDDPVQDDWEAQPAAVRVYVPRATGAEPSSTDTDFGATNSTNDFNPYNEIRTLVDPQRAQGSHLSVRLAGQVAEGFVAVKGLVVTVAPTASNRTRQ
jgi:hypothetical protein